MRSWENKFFWSCWWLSSYRGHSGMKCWTASIFTQSHPELSHFFFVFIYPAISSQRCGKERDPKKAWLIRISNQLDLVACKYRKFRALFIMSSPFRVGIHIFFFPRASVCPSVSLSVCPSVCLSVTNRVLSITWKPLKLYTPARVFVLRIRVSCAFPTRCTCVEFKLRMKRESTYFETHEYSLAAL